MWVQMEAVDEMQADFEDVNIVTDPAEPSPEVRFKYVYIPCDESAPMEEREMVTTKRDVMSCLIGDFPDRDVYSDASPVLCLHYSLGGCV